MTEPRRTDIGKMTVGRKPTGIQWLWGMTDYPQYEAAQAGGYPYGYEQWKREGKPKETQLTSRTQALMAMPGYEALKAYQQETRQYGPQGAGPPPFTAPTPKPADEKIPTMKTMQFETYEEALAAAPAGWEPELDNMGHWTFRRVPTKAGQEMPSGFYKTYKEAAVAAPEGFVPYQTSDGWWGYREAEKPEAISPYQQAQLDLQRQQGEQEQGWQQQQMNWNREQARMQQQEQERQYRSQLLANPMSWLQYSAYTGETPAVQEWMKPLMSQQYQAGQALPGWQTGQATGQAMSSLAELRNPSAQYFARMGPTAQQQWAGYQQTRTGVTPEESQFRLRAGAPPSGRYGGLRWSR